MAQAGYTPISLYYSTTAAAVPTSGNLANGELGINIQDEKLYFKNAAGTVKLLASNATSAPVLTFSAGTTGFTPNTATSGAITLAGTLGTANGGTNLGGATPFTSGGVVYASSTSALTTNSGFTYNGNDLVTGPIQFTLASNVTSIDTYNYDMKLTSVRAGGIGGKISLFTGTTSTVERYSIDKDGTAVWTIGSEQMRLTSTGLGIGTSSPATKLHVSTSSTSEVLRIESTSNPFLSIYNSGTREFYLQASTNIDVWGQANKDMRFGTNDLERVRITSAGNVGIGTSSPETYSGYTVLEVKGPTEGGRISANYNNSVYMTMFANSNGLGYVGTNSAHSAVFITSGTERMRITSAGNVGIGTSSPSAKLHVIGSATQIVMEPSLGSGDSEIMIGRGYSLSGTPAIVGTKSFVNCAFEGSNDSAYSAFGYITTAVGTRVQTATDLYFETKSAGASAPAERARIDSVGNLLVGTTNLNGAVANNRAIVGGGFHSLNGELTTLASGTAYTMFTAPADFATYLVNVHGGASAAIYSETAIVQINNTSVRVDIISDGPTVVIDNSGLAIRATQNSGNTMGYLIWSAVRMA